MDAYYGPQFGFSRRSSHCAPSQNPNSSFKFPENANGASHYPVGSAASNIYATSAYINNYTYHIHLQQPGQYSVTMDCTTKTTPVPNQAGPGATGNMNGSTGSTKQASGSSPSFLGISPTLPPSGETYLLRSSDSGNGSSGFGSGGSASSMNKSKIPVVQKRN